MIVIKTNNKNHIDLPLLNVKFFDLVLFKHPTYLFCNKAKIFYSLIFQLNCAVVGV